MDTNNLNPGENAFMMFIIACNNACQVWEARDVGFLGDEWTSLANRGMLTIEVGEDGTTLTLVEGAAELWQLHRAVKHLQAQMRDLFESPSNRWELTITKDDVSLNYRKNSRKDIRDDTMPPRSYVGLPHVSKRLTGVGFDNPFKVGDKLRHNFGRHLPAGTVTEVVDAFHIKLEGNDRPTRISYYELD